MGKVVGIVNPGMMGIAVARSMKNGGNRVLWASEGRSAATRARAEEADLTEVATLDELCAQAEIVVSVCPPHSAENVADTIIATRFSGIFCDANAISPRSVGKIGRKMAAANISFVDGSIIGLPPTRCQQSWLYLSGEHAPAVAALFSEGPLEAEVIGTEIGKASALKMCYAANTKGVNALFTAIFGLADHHGVLDVLINEWSRNGGNMAADRERRLVSVAANKAWRFAGEMEEIADTFADAGLPDGIHRASAEIYRRIGHLRHADSPVGLEDVLTALNSVDERQ